MPDDGIFKVKNGDGYDVYVNGKDIGWFKNKKDAQKAYDDETDRLNEMANSQNRNQNDDDSNEPQARANESVFITNVLSSTQKPKFWFWVFFLAGILAFAGWMGWLDPIPWTKVLTTIFLIAFGIFIAYGFKTSGKHEVRFWVALALAIWLLDMWTFRFNIPGLGWLDWLLSYNYSGFIWNWSFDFNTTIYAIFASSFTLIFLYVNMVFDIIGKKYIGFLLGFFFILLVNNILAPFFFDESSIRIPYGIILFIGIFVIGGFVAYWKRDRLGSELGIFISSLFMIVVFSFFWLNNDWMLNPKAIIHAVYIVLFGFLFIVKKEKESETFWHYLIPFLLIFDFYGYGFLWSTNYLVLKFIPILVLFVVTYCYHKTEDKYSMATFIFIVTIMLILSLKAYGYQPTGEVKFTPRQDGTDFTDLTSGLIKGLGDIVLGKIDDASGGYFFNSDVEKNQFEPLGVYIDNVKLAQPRFYSNEDVTLWATVKSKTLNDPVVVNFTCSRWKDGKRILASFTTDKTTTDDILIPNWPFIVYTFEENDVECTFTQNDNKQKFPVGSNKVTLSAQYNFQTSAYQKLYFMDKARLREMRRENLDPFKEFGITDTDPPTIFTNGPVELALEMSPLNTVTDETSVPPNLGILLKNRDTITDKDGKPIGKWEGKIKKINDILVVLPKGMEIVPDSCNPVTFNPVTMDGYCPGSCLNLCTNTCLAFKDSKIRCEEICGDPTMANDQEKITFKPQIDNLKKCSSDCTQLFTGEGTDQYTGYRLNAAEIKDFGDEFKDIDRHKVFGCRVKINSDILDNVPITTRFIRAVARYDYLIDQTHAVTIDQSQIQEPTTPSSPVTIPPLQVLSCSNFGSQEKTFTDGYTKYETQIRNAANVLRNKVNVPEAIIAAIISQESAWDEDAVSPCGAAGLGQFVPNTARGYGLNVPVYTFVDCNPSLCKTKVSECNACTPTACKKSEDDRFKPDIVIPAISNHLNDLLSNPNCLTLDRAINAYNSGSCDREANAGYRTRVLNYYNIWVGCLGSTLTTIPTEYISSSNFGPSIQDYPKVKTAVLNAITTIINGAKSEGIDIVVTSALRDQARYSYSCHMLGEAADLVIMNPEVANPKNPSAEDSNRIQEVIDLAKSAGMGFIQDEYRNPSSGATGPHIHIGLTTAPNCDGRNAEASRYKSELDMS